MHIKKILKNIMIKFQTIYIKRVLQNRTVNSNCICFQSSPDFSDNSYALFKYLESAKKNYVFYWLVDTPSQFKKYETPNVHFIRKNILGSSIIPLKTIRTLLSAKYSFFTHQSILQEYRNNNQLQINLWHGCGYKDIHNKSSRILFDYVLVPGSLFIETKTRFFSCDRKKVLPLGYPRYDDLLDTQKILLLHQKIAGDKFRKIILWMPTFRKTKQNYSENLICNDYFLPICTSDEDLKRLNSECKRLDTLLIIKRHRNQLDNYVDLNLTNIRFIDDTYLSSQNILLYTLIGTADALITDYSSVAVDYMLLDRPIGFTLDDYEEYKRLRGFVFDNVLDYMPGYHIYTLSQLIIMLQDIASGIDNYRDARANLFDQMHSLPKGSSYCERIADFFQL